MVRSRGEPVYGDPSLPASATITMTHRYGGVLSGYPLAVVCVMRNLLLGSVGRSLAMMVSPFVPVL